MAQKTRKAKRGAQAAPVEGNANRKRKATKPLENRRIPSPPEAKKRLHKAGVQLDKITLHPPTVQRISLKNLALATSNAQTSDPGSIIKYVNERRWKPRCAAFAVVGGRRAEFVAPVASKSENAYLALIEWGHKATKDGDLESAYLVLLVEGLTYWIAFDNPYKDQKRTILHQCMDLYVQNRHADLLDFLVPIFQPFWSKASAKPYPDNLQSFLHRARTYLRLLPTGVLAPYPEFESLPCVDWGAYLKLWPSTRIWSLSDVKRFALNTTTISIFEVAIDDQGEPLVYKMVRSYHRLVREVEMLLYCARVNIRAPRFQGLIGIDTKWGGFLMTKVPTLFLLSELPWDTTPLDDRQRWYDQISDAVQKVHEGGHTWGDVKPENVLIDTNRDACLADFDGGFTQGWVDAELVETKAGDLQGLGRIRSFLKLDEGGPKPSNGCKL
ncbi:hypothetical protein ASPCAL07473 [Aspergillus calidoustus]|uniref:Protein kinase domain-containing protein n=1 Tax=Aspergillus calidoustus TaxID=454130 RepID=A0A0U5G9P9_ASPCI|nr:hypothetical protein ASPCAL07473 [Aspergillus calidoustus]